MTRCFYFYSQDVEICYLSIVAQSGITRQPLLYHPDEPFLLCWLYINLYVLSLILLLGNGPLNMFIQ